MISYCRFIVPARAAWLVAQNPSRVAGLAAAGSGVALARAPAPPDSRSPRPLTNETIVLHTRNSNQNYVVPKIKIFKYEN